MKKKPACLKYVFIVLCCLLVSQGVHAQEDRSLERRLELANTVQNLRPVDEQVDMAIEQFLTTLPQSERENARKALKDILNIAALRKVSVDAYADVFTERELEVMAEYYAKPESAKISKKMNAYAARVYPEIIRMLDKAMMRVKTGG